MKLQFVLFVVMKRELMLVGILLLMIFFVANGVNILTNGKIGPTRRTLLQSGMGLSRLSRFAFTAIYILAAATAAYVVLLIWR